MFGPHLYSPFAIRYSLLSTRSVPFELVHRYLADHPWPPVLGCDRRCGLADCSTLAPPHARRRATRVVAGSPHRRARQPDLAAGGARKPRQHRHRGDGRVDLANYRWPARAGRRHQVRSRGQARQDPEPRGQVGVVVQAHRRRPLRHQSLRRPQPGAGQRTARPPRRRHHDHRRPGARHSEIGSRPRLRRARARHPDRPPGRVRSPHRGDQGAEVRHRRPGPRHRGRRARPAAAAVALSR